MSVAPPRGVGDIRMIRIVDVDYQPCGGTHIRNLSEIGPVVVSKIENKGKQTAGSTFSLQRPDSSGT